MEKRVFIIIIIILLVFFGKIFGKKIFEPTTKITEDEENQAVNNMNNESGRIEDETQSYEFSKATDMQEDIATNSDATGKDQQKGNTVRYDYMDLYPDLYVDEKDKHPITTEQSILDSRKDSLEYSKPKNYDDEEEGEEKKVAFLTFDDGPSDNTSKVLDILEEHDIKATFFMIADTITPDRYDLIRQMIDEGHLVGIHTYTHNYRQIYSSVKAYLDDFYLAFTRIKEITGEKPTVFRFPGGSFNCYMKPLRKQIIAEMQRRGFTYYDWHVSAEDSVGNPSKASIIRNIKRNYKRYNTPIVLLHDSSINELTINSLEDIIQLYEDAGYSFDTVNNRVSRKAK